MDKAKEEFANHEIVLNDINAHEDRELVYFSDLLEEVSKKVTAYDIDRVFHFDNLGIAVQTNEQMFNQVGSYISSSIVIKSTHPVLGNDIPASPTSVVKEDRDNWICLRCYQVSLRAKSKVMYASAIFC